MASSNNNKTGEFHELGGQSSSVASEMPSSSRPPPSFRACIACRQMKMKCEGVEGEPCIRCSKVGRECIPQTSTRKTTRPRPPPQQHTNQPPSGVVEKSYQTSLQRPGSLSYTSPPINTQQAPVIPRPRSRAAAYHLFPAINHDLNHGVDGVRHVQNEVVTELPSIYSTPPIDTVTAEGDSGAASPHILGSMTMRKRRRHSTSTPENQLLLTPSQSHRGEDALALSRGDMRDMINLFQQRHVPYLPLFRPEYFQDVDNIIDHEPRFAFAMCYVTARYLPGGKEIRESLLPEVIRIPKDVYTAKVGNHDDDMCLLKALTVLYSYADLTPPSQAVRPTDNECLLYWSLKAAAEMYAFRLSLHRSIQELKRDLATNSGNIYNTKSYQRYTYWLFFYNMSHYCSLVTGTPPTMRVDLSIRAVTGLLDQIGRYPEYPTNLFGATELFLIWEATSTAHPQLGEWWCLPDPDERADENLTESLLNAADTAIDEWYSKWWNFISAEPRGSTLDYHGRFTRFCLASYAIKSLRISSEGPTALQQSQLQRCVSYANHVLDYPLSRGPVEKDNLRYVDDAACIIVSFCCIFILSACQAFPNVILNVSDCMGYVTDAANLMIELAINENHKPYHQGVFLLKRVESLKAAMEMSRLHEQKEANVAEPSDTRLSPAGVGDSRVMLEGFDQIFHEDGLFGLEPIWDFSMLFPGT